MKTLHFADVHGNDKNIEEVETNTDFMIDVAKKEKPDLIVCAGDVTDSKNTKMGSVTAHVTIKQFSKMADIAPVIICLGTDSHDGLAPLILSSVIGKYPIYVSERPEQVILQQDKFRPAEGWEVNPKMLITTCPTPSKKFFQTDSSIEETNNEIGHNLGVMFAGFGVVANKYDCYKVFAGHFSVNGAKISDTQIMVGRDIEVSTDQLQSTNSDVICLGHIHKSQEMKNNVFYSGSVYRKTFGENEDKGFYIHEQGKESRFIVLPAIRRDCYDFDFTTMNSNPELMALDPEEIKEVDFNFVILGCFKNVETALDFRETEIKIRYKIWQDDAVKVNEKIIKDFFISNGALDCKLEPNVIPREMIRNEDINNVDTVTEKIAVFHKHRGKELDPEILDRLSFLESGSSVKEIIDKYSIDKYSIEKENVEKEDIHPLILKMLCDKSEDCPEGNMETDILFMGQDVRVSCDKKCNLAWGHNGLEYDKEDNPIIPEGNAPEDPGTYEGGEAKPTGVFSGHNKWCVRECERSTITDL